MVFGGDLVKRGVIPTIPLISGQMNGFPGTTISNMSGSIASDITQTGGKRKRVSSTYTILARHCSGTLKIRQRYVKMDMYIPQFICSLRFAHGAQG
jgi:hypothetical protein